MPAAVETMMYTNEVPWHGLGEYVADAPTPTAALKTAGIDWRVNKEKLFLADGKDVFGHYALVRDSDGKVLDVVGKDYHPHQNRDTFKLFDAFAKAGGATMETAGSLKGGKLIWGLARLKRDIEVTKGDKLRNYLLLASPHEQGKSAIFKATNVRVVCMNTMTMALREVSTEMRIHHRKEFDDSILDRAKDVFGVTEEVHNGFEKNAKKLSKIKVNMDDVVRILAPVFQKGDDVEQLVTHRTEAGVFAPRMKLLLDVYERAPGAVPGNAWGVFNAVTYWADHLASRTPDKRLERAWVGKTAQLKDKVLSTLLDMAA